MLPDLGKVKVFTKVDLQSGYWHCTLDEDSSNMIPCVTPFGRCKWLRLSFGLNVSFDIFHIRLNMVLKGLEVVMSVADDVILYGTVDHIQHATEKHDAKLRELLLRCRTKGLRLKQKQMPVSYQWYHISGTQNKKSRTQT